MKILKLPPETRLKLQNGMIVTDAVQCVLELVHNSIDAEATGIAVKIDLKSYKIQVIDNGKGIGKDDLELVGERFMTSKHQPSFDFETSFFTYGFKGQALSSLLDVSRSLIIETKSETEGPTYIKVFQNSKALPIAETTCEKQGTGTTVSVEDFMYTMPVRRKRINEVFDMEEIKCQLQHLAIIHYNTSQASSILESLKNIYGKALVKSFKTLYYKEKKYEITGFISLKAQTQDNMQLVYLNKRVITKGVIHKFINNLTKEYRRKKASFTDSPVEQIMKNIKGSYQTAFIIHILCPHSYYELFSNVRKTTVEFRNWKDLLKCIHKAIKITFKSFINLNNLPNNHQYEDEFKITKNKKDKKAFGTSLLLNAVKGAPAKRSLNFKKNVKKRKKNNEDRENFGFSLSKTNVKSTYKLQDESLETITQQKEYINDSLESPIPKKNFKWLCDSKHSETTSFNQSFVNFYKWLKSKLETDINAFNLYNDYLHFKNSNSQNEDVKVFKSPILGGKPKTKKVIKSKKKISLENKKKFFNDSSANDQRMANTSKRQFDKFQNAQLKSQKAVQLSELNSSSISKNLNSVTTGNLNFETCNSQSVFKKPENVTVFKRGIMQAEYSPSLRSSEMQFTNIIKFRNLPESCSCQLSGFQNKIPVEKIFPCPASDSWASHYQDFAYNKVDFPGEERGRENYLSPLKTQEGEIPKKTENSNFDFYNCFDAGLIDLTPNAKGDHRLQNVEIQVDMTEISGQKVNALVQTYSKDPELSFVENSYALYPPNYLAPGRESECDFLEHQNEYLKSDNYQEVPKPDFWNTTAHMEFEKDNAGDITLTNDAVKNNFTSDIVNEKNSESSEFICGHKSHSFIKLQNEKSVSKETQTLVTIWTDSLTKLEHESEKVKMNTEMNLNSVDSNAENTEVLKTSLNEEIQDVVLQPNQFKFCLTERHDFVPKGLSPKFLFPEASKISILTSHEKSKLKSAIDETQNEFLANIKWQDDSTGDCLKPTIPDKIFAEMRRKAGESALDYENLILSASMSYCAVKVHNLLHSFALTKELLSDVEILGQLDKKFIVTKIKITSPKKMKLISLFDQHAVDERIKLEELINENLSVDGKLISTSLNPPVECLLAESDVRVVAELQEKILNYGLSAQSINENKIFVNRIPTFLLSKHEKDLKNNKETALSDAIKALIVNIVSETIETRGAVPKIPKTIHNALCLEACHKAIKFNKPLTMKCMNEMIQKLQSCKLPFQCAHGRPSVIPIIDLEDFNPLIDDGESIDIQRLKKFFHERKHNMTVKNGR